jgi:uncharacterized protein YecA (UPF0149 family)
MHKELKEHKVTIYTPTERGIPLTGLKFERNKPCHCGSGKKLKKCCGEETRYSCKAKSK